jgi:uncharacterized membrane protein
VIFSVRNEWWVRHKGKIVGAAAGLFLAIIYLFFGFWDMLVVAFIISVCLYLGKIIDDQEQLPDVDDWLKKLGDQWRRFR